MPNTGNQIYDAAATVGKIQMGFSVIICTLIAFVLFIVAYFNNKNWNYNLVNITGTIVSINTPNGECIETTQQNGNSRSILYNCPLTASYILNDNSSSSVTNYAPSVSGSTVNLYTSSNTRYVPGQSIGLTYDTASTAKPTIEIFRIQTPWIVGGAFFFLLVAYIDYQIAVSTAAKPYLAYVGVNAMI